MTKDRGQEGRCLTCQYAQMIDKEDYDAVPDWCDYECHRHAPAMVHIGDGKVMSFWPGTSGFNWCGDYKGPDVLEIAEEAEHGKGQGQECKAH